VSARVVIGLFLGGLLAFLISALTMSAVGRAAFKMVNEVRRQFRNGWTLWNRDCRSRDARHRRRHHVCGRLRTDCR
ncbi:sodium/proton-translocating pyrophosphatase, partial [bacterium]|nr:sodium/proton-translocating pyrophosphatase [bacterium]